jgi:hypothetical protein
MPIPAPDLCRTWLFGPGAETRAHQAMQQSGADALIADLEDFTPPARRIEARRNLAGILPGLMLCAGLMLVCYLSGRRRNFPLLAQNVTARGIRKATLVAARARR